MKKTLIIIRYEFKQILKKKTFIVATLAIPLLLFLGYGIYQGVEHWREPGAPAEKKIGYVDNVGAFTEYTRQDDITFIPYTNGEEAREALVACEVAEYFIIPSDYLSSGLITRYIIENEFEVPDDVWRGIEDFLLSNLLGDEVSSELLERAKVPMGLNTIQLDESGEIASEQDAASRYVLPIVFGLLFAFAILFSSGYLLQSVTEEKENRVIEVLLSSVSSSQLLVGKVLGLGTAGLLQIAVWFIAIWIFIRIASVNIPFLSELSITASVFAWGIVYFILGYLLFAAYYAAVGSLCSTAKEAHSLSGIIVLPAMLPLWLNFFIIGNPEGAFARALTLFPLSAPIAAMMRISRDSLAAWEIALSIIILVASAILTIWIASKLFRVFLLMYGKKPGLREIVRCVREA
ncbi:MAG TPA: ABC transporter permease [Dehalococcoidia bacterium]|nr:ABC transporter permease [Dehalococcoidia bacterium]